MALAILLRSPDVKVLGVSTTPGIAEPALARTRVGRLLKSLGENPKLLDAEPPAGADILATGPLTRVAQLITAGKAPKRVTWMGGTIRAKGNHKGGAEWNAGADARALNAVLHARLPLTICPLDLTNQFSSRANIVEPGQNALLTDIHQAYGERERYWWDELAAASIAAPGLFRKQQMRLKADRRGRLTAALDGAPVDVLSECDRAGFEALLSGSLRGLP